MSYQDDYDSACSRYNEACYYRNACYYKGQGLQTQKRLKISEINNLNMQLNEHKEALSQVKKLKKYDDDIDKDIMNICYYTGVVSDIYKAMIVYDVVYVYNDTKPTNLTDVFDDEVKETIETMDSIFESFNTAQKSLNEKIETYKKQIKTAKEELKEIEKDIKNNDRDYDDWGKKKTSASYDMEYYKRKMEEEEEEKSLSFA